MIRTTPPLKKQMKKGNVASQVLLVRQAGGSWSEYVAALNNQSPTSTNINTNTCILTNTNSNKNEKTKQYIVPVWQARRSWSEYLAALNHQQAQIRIHTYEQKNKQKQKKRLFLVWQAKGSCSEFGFITMDNQQIVKMD